MSSQKTARFQKNTGKFTEETKWILCPVCNSKTRLKIRVDTELKNFPLFCPKCKRETLINVKQYATKLIGEPDAKTQYRK